MEKGYLQGVGKFEKYQNHAIGNVYFVNGLKHSLLYVSQICDKGNELKFMLDGFTVSNIKFGEVILAAKGCKNK